MADDLQTQENEAAADAQVMPEGMPADLWDSEAGTLKMTELTARMTELEQLRAGKAAVPESQDAYELALPEDFQIPEGLDFSFDPSAEDTAAFKGLAHELGLSQEQASKLLAFDAKRKLAEVQGAVEGVKAARAALGEKAGERITAVEGYLKATLSADKYEALRPFVSDATAFAALEDLIKHTKDGAVPPTPPTPPAKAKTTAEIMFGGT